MSANALGAKVGRVIGYREIIFTDSDPVQEFSRRSSPYGVCITLFRAGTDVCIIVPHSFAELVEKTSRCMCMHGGQKNDARYFPNETKNSIIPDRMVCPVPLGPASKFKPKSTGGPGSHPYCANSRASDGMRPPVDCGPISC